MATHVYDSVRKGPENPLDPWTYKETVFDWKTWKENPHSQGHIKDKEAFWEYYNQLAEENVEVLYPNSIEMSFTGGGN